MGDPRRHRVPRERRPAPPVHPPGPRGLYLVGETTDVPTIQMDAAALSAMRCADLVMGA